MSLYGKDDSNTNVTKAGRGVSASSQAKTIVFVDNTEAALAENKLRGLNAPGWWSYFTYTDGNGNTRHKAEHLITIADPEANASETQSDDTIAADVASVISISTQPANRTGVATPYTNASAFTVTAASVPSVVNTVNVTLSYQWQYQTPSQTVKWTNVANTAPFSGATTATLALTAAAKATYDGYKFRVKITSSIGGEEVTSNTATLTFA